MDKDIMKRLFAAAGLPTPKHVSFLRSEWRSAPKKIVKRAEEALKYPMFVKPANLGSSVGISKAHDRKELGPAIDLAANYDRKIVIEQGDWRIEEESGRQGARAGGRRAWQRIARGFGRRRDRSRQGILRLRGEVPERFVGADHSRQDHARAIEADSRDGDCGLSRLRLLGAGAGRLPDGAGVQKRQSRGGSL